MTTIDGMEFNLNRIMRVRVYHISGRGENQRVEEVIAEFCPYDNPDLNARIDAEIKYMPVVGNKNGKSGFSGKITIYNPPPSLINLVNTYATWMIDYGSGNGNANASAYYASRCLVSVEVGYWNDKKEDGRDYKMVLGPDAYLNSSAYYRKGTDNLLELYCHNVKLNSTEMASAISTQTRGNKKVERITDAEVIENKIIGGRDKTWYFLAQEVIRKYDKERTAPLAVPTWGKDIFAIYPPKNTNNPGEGMEIDYGLQVELEGLLTPGLVANGKTLEDMLQELCDFVPGTIRYKRKIISEGGFVKNLTNKDEPAKTVTTTKYYFWRIKGEAVTKKEATTITNKDVVIYDFQNMLQVPSVDGSGCFTMKMLFNRDIEPGNRVFLKWSGASTATNGISPFTQGVSSTAKLAQYYPSLQAGDKQAQVAAVLRQNGVKDSGYLFNVGYYVAYVTHKLSTHANSWSTEIKTTSAIARIN